MQEKPEPSAPAGVPPAQPASFLAAAAALAAIDDAVRAAGTPPAGERTPGAPAGAEQALAALLLLREVRTQLAGWEAGLVEAARDAGATWADIAQPMGVASRQAAENRYLRLKPTAAGSGSTGTATGAERVKAVRDRRAAERTVTTWARANAADLRTLAAQITALTDHAPEARSALTDLHQALGAPDAADLIAPLAGMRPHLGTGHPELAGRLDAVARQADRLRRDSDRRRT
ncbi:hypothetical protein [Peterkaempfera griseoplana]|uniref:hypothetical protein n=1 Tax=Peterkaempfera griseoplana TaxID=66896 RepID=UPI0006E41546|nr:hypothetical protein [Peterkaempfera griseoplana]